MTAPLVFLSASVPEKRDYVGNDQHLATSQPQRIRDAVLATSREAFRRNYSLVIGAHPSISPMILTVAQEFHVTTPPRVLVYQSNFFAGRFPKETLELTDPKHALGELVTTDAMPDLDQSLLEMRTQMFHVPGLVAAVFIGGMNGILDEAELFYGINQSLALPMYAVGSVGCASQQLHEQGWNKLPAAEFSGRPYADIGSAILGEWRRGYRPLARAIFDALDRARTAKQLHSRG